MRIRNPQYRNVGAPCSKRMPNPAKVMFHLYDNTYWKHEPVAYFCRQSRDAKRLCRDEVLICAAAEFEIEG